MLCVSARSIPVLLEDVPIAIRRDMWFRQDGVQTHYGAQVQQHLNTHFLVDGLEWLPLI